MGNFVYDSAGNLIEDRFNRLKISYDWRGMLVEFVHDVSDAKDAYKLVMAYDGAGRRISKTRMKKTAFDGPWYASLVTHYTGIGTEIRENPVNHEAKVVMNMPNGLGRYEPEDAAVPPSSSTSRTFEWYLKNHLGSTMLVYASGYGTPGVVRAAYDYRAFGEQVKLTESADKVTENFTGKEKDDETELNYFGARYLDPMLGVWTSVDPMRQYQNPFIYAGNNPIMRIDPDGNLDANAIGLSLFMDETLKPQMQTAFETGVDFGEKAIIASSVATIGVLSVGAVAGAAGSGMITAGYERASVFVAENYGEIMFAGEFLTSFLGPPSSPTSTAEAVGLTVSGIKAEISNYLSNIEKRSPLEGVAPADNTNIVKPFDEEW